MEGKICTTCKEFKPYSEFHKFKRMSDGYEIYCKQCRKDYYKNKDFYKNKLKGKKEINPFEIRIVNGSKMEGKKCTKCNLWKAKSEYHKFKRLSGGHEIYCKDCRSQMLSIYNQTEKGKQTSYRSRMNRRSRNNGVRYTEHDRLYILNRDKWTCQNCGIKVHDKKQGRKQSPDKAHIDHVISLVEGGNSEPKNLQTLCRTCNLRKNYKGEEQLSLF